MVASMIRKDATFGTMCRRMIRNGPTPISPAARTNSSCFSESVIDRITRAVTIQLKSAIIATSAIHPVARSRGDTIAMIRKLGKTSSRSTTNISTRSAQPPKNPAQAPTSDDSTVENSATSSPMISDFRSPCMLCARMSCPIGSVPHQCEADGPSYSAE